ncbi:MAG: SDR family NAD(P)-dependent oxidoreductase, partial [Bacteroidota bacterium]
MRQQPNNRLNHQTCIVAGASSGIGKAIALAMGRDGARVIVNYYGDDESAEAVANEICQMDGTADAIPFKCDVSKEDQVEKMFRTAIDRYGTVDILVANAGIQIDAPFHEMELDQWQRVIDVNLTGQFLCARAAVREYLRRGMREDISCALGKIIHISSVHEIIPWAGHINYAASKGGIVML